MSWTTLRSCASCGRDADVPSHGLIQTFELGPEWQEFAGVYKPSPKSDAKFSFVLAVPPGTVAILDDFAFWKE